MLNYYNNNTYAFTWDLGRKLTAASVNGNTLAFTYDDNGIRTSKTVNGVEHVYNVSGSTILSEAWGNHLIMYMYDDNGQPVGMQYRNTAYAANTFDTYWFEKYVVGNGSKIITVRSYQRSFELLLQKQKISHHGFHALRHTFATRAIECGMDVKSLSEILGHKNPTITLRMIRVNILRLNK